jgi:hypothetical protein
LSPILSAFIAVFAVPSTIWTHSDGTTTIVDTVQVSVHGIDDTVVIQRIAPRGSEGGKVMIKLQNGDRGLSPGLLSSAIVFGESQKRDDSSLSRFFSHHGQGIIP